MRMRTAVCAASLAAALALAVPAVAAAGNGGGSPKSSSSISLAQPTEPGYGDFVSFSVSTTATTQPWVNLKCFQSGALVAEGWAAYFGTNPTPTFGLYSPMWTGGAADCTAYLDMYANGRFRPLASTSFQVSA
jgi:hypothetical protein